MLICARDYYAAGLRELARDPWLSAVGPTCDPVVVEEQRVGKRTYKASLAAQPDATDIASAIFNIPREYVSDGIEQVYEIINSLFPCTMHRFSTGSAVGETLVPEKWRGDDALISTLSGQPILSTRNGTLKIASYSLPLDREVSLVELKEHLHCGPVDTMPACSLYRTRNWGLATSEKYFSLLTDAQYRVSIATQSSFGQLLIAECLLGSRGKCYTYICELGLAATYERLREDLTMITLLLTKDLRNSYQILFLPSEEWIDLVPLRGERVQSSFIVTGESLA